MAAAAAGTYNDKIQYVRTTPCTPCPNGTTNTLPASDNLEDCDSE
jgi:deoxycytidylate deaminase